MELTISKEKPIIYERLHKQFGVEWDDNIIIAFDGKIHCKENPPPQKLVHESIHLLEQGKMGNSAWWNLYCENDSFRFEQERLAYVAEANFIKKYVKNREDRFHMITDIAKSFSSSVYGSIITTSEALKLLL